MGILIPVSVMPNCYRHGTFSNLAKKLVRAIFLHKGRQNSKATRVYCTSKNREKDTR